jgi:hypothetical protein
MLHGGADGKRILALVAWTLVGLAVLVIGGVVLVDLIAPSTQTIGGPVRIIK